MTTKNAIYALLGGATLALAGCGGGGGGNGGGDPTPTPTPTSPPTASVCDETFVTCSGTTATLSGLVNKDLTLESSFNWVLSGFVTVGQGNVEITSNAQAAAIKADGVTLTIPAGTDIKATDDGVLLITRGSKIMAEGTAQAPITFSSLDEGFDGLGEWGGLVVQGFAPQYGQGGTGVCYQAGNTFCNVDGEGGGNVAKYGGNDPLDNSGVIKYVRIAEGGLVAGPNNEINGLTLQGVGSATVVDYVHVHNNLDDGVEWFGGTVNATHLILTGNDDDDIDFDEGYQGNIQYAIVIKSNNPAPQGSNDPRGIEANSSDDEYTPETNAAIANVTLIGGAVNNSAGGQQPGMRLRGALTVAIYNSAVKGFDTGCVRIDDADTDGDSTNDQFSMVSLTNVFGDCVDGFYDKRAADTENGVGAQSISFDAAWAINESFANVGATSIAAVDNGSGFAFDATSFVGAVAPGTTAANAWWAGWAIPGTLAPADEAPAAASFASIDEANKRVTITGDITQDYVFVNGYDYILDGVVRVGQGNVEILNEGQAQAIRDAGVTLTIRPGVSVLGLDDGVLIVTRGSKLIADGTAAAPITFASIDPGYDGLGEWGGVVVQGFAPQFGQGNTGNCHGANSFCNVDGEGGGAVAKYGGDDPSDNSGIIRYVRIAEGGLVAGPNNEVNGLTLQGVGHGTLIDYVQVHNNLDDGVEWFGGTVNARHLVLTGNDDDDIDYDEGYMGNVQFAIIKKSAALAAQGSNDPRGIEANSSDDEYVPQTAATLANILLIGNNVNNAAGNQQPGMRLRGAVTTSVYNTAVRDFDTGCIRIDDADTDGDGNVDVNSTVALVNVIGECQDSFYDKRAADTETNAAAGTVTVDSAYALTDAAATLAGPVSIPATDNGSGFSFEATSFIGAVAPGTATGDAWWAGWTIPGSL